MRGELLWFNKVKNLGVIRTEDGERLHVDLTAFEPGNVPEGRCAGTKVSFVPEPATADAPARALAVSTVIDGPQRRARLRRHH